jgi:AraC-like DNA-binding protein
MHAWESIQKVLDYIEENIAQNHSPEELSKIAALSPFYFQRLFTRLVKRPVSEYIKMRRLARACETLDDKSKRILDIALEYGFNSHEYFTKTFKGAFGITPEEYRNNPVRLNQIIKPDLLLNYTMIDENVPLITDGIILEISRKIIDTQELYIGLSAPVSISEQTPLGETPGIDIPGLLWDDLAIYLRESYNVQPQLFYSGCSMQDGYWKGWNVKYKKSNKALCTLYPKQGYFIALITVGKKEIVEADLLIPLCDEYTQNLYYKTDFGSVGKSLPIEVKNASILYDVKELIAIWV